MRHLRAVLFGRPTAPVERSTYLTVGLSLMAVKYTVDALLIAVFAGVFWTPLDYLLPMITFNASKVALFPRPLNIALLLWAVPFIWIGVTLSVRRAIDALVFPGLVVLFFVPFLNYLLMVALALVPTRSRDASSYLVEPPTAAPDRPPRWGGSATSTQWGIIAGAAAGVAGVGLAVLTLHTYGVAVFLGLPFAVGMISAIVANRVEPRSRKETVMIGQATMAAMAGMVILVAMEGAICLVMALPIASPLVAMGSIIGQLIAGRERPPSFNHITLLLLAVPLGAGIEAAMPVTATRVVLTAVDIDAPPSVVWGHVVSFSEIRSAPAWYFRTGLAYPLRARIAGRGVGAVRHCEFTTGAFVEPITVWDEPRRLAFDVIAQPPPLQEWSPYSRVYAPHLDGFFRTTHGEFRLVPLVNGGTRLEGRTWYSLDMQPALYWQSVADGILHAVHDRVLQHVKAEAERAG